MIARSYDVDGKPFRPGDWAEHVNGKLDARKVTKILPGNKVMIFILTSACEVEASNYRRIRPKTVKS